MLTGSRVSLRGKFDEPLRSLRAVAQQDGSPNTVGTAERSTESSVWTAQLSRDGSEFELFADGSQASVIEEDRRWRLEIETLDGLRVLDPKPWAIHVTLDRPPSITLAPIEPRGITQVQR